MAGGNGVCASVIETATGNSGAPANLQAISDESTPVGRAFARSLCDRDLCLAECSMTSEAQVPSGSPVHMLLLAALLLLSAIRWLSRDTLGAIGRS
jgi:hypothetical protein